MVFNEELDEIYKHISQLPLYKRRLKEEVFLGIVKSKTKKWIGWKYVKIIKKIKEKELDYFLNLYELSLNYYYLKSLTSKTPINYKNLIKNYNI